MAIENLQQDVQIEPPQVDVTPPETPPEVDLSAVPEKVREHVDKTRYSTDQDYKRAVEHGWKPKDVFLAEGGDEADWTGYRTFNRRYDDRHETKAFKKELEEMRRNTDVLIRTLNEEKSEAVKKAIADRDAQLKIAIQDGDAAKAVEIQREIMEMRSREQNFQPPQQAAPEPLAVIALRNSIPALNPQSPEFNQEVNAEFELHAKQRALEYHGIYNRKLSDLEIKVIVDEAYNMVKDRLKKPAPLQKPPAVSAPANDKKAAPRMTGLQKQFYDKLKATNPEAAERYLKNTLNS